jgi:CTP:molybdopterin cytidylyltransferase MocA
MNGPPDARSTGSRTCFLAATDGCAKRQRGAEQASPPLSWAAILLLAGHSRRMGTLKQHVVIDTRTFLEHILGTLQGTSPQPNPLILVGQAGDHRSRQTVAAIPGSAWVHNPQPGDGPLSSVRCGLDLLGPNQGFLLWPIDHPLVSSSTIAALLHEVGRDAARLIVPSDGRRRGHPVWIPGWAADELRTSPLEDGARWVFSRFPERIFHVIVNDPWIRGNLDHPADLEKARQALFSGSPSRPPPDPDSSPA